MALVKWLASITEEQREWLEETVKATNLNGAAIIRELIERARKENSAEFRRSLAQLKLQAELQKLNDKELAIQVKREELTKKMKKDKVSVPV